MGQFDTAYLFAEDLPWFQLYLVARFGVGCLLVTLGIAIVIIDNKRRSVSHRSLAISLGCAGAIWLMVHLPMLKTYDQYLSIQDVYEQKQYEIVEGEVVVLHQQPSTGHDEGDIVEVDGLEFEVDYFDSTPGYKKTLAHGGILRDGIIVRLYYFEDKILRIDLYKE